MESVNSSPSSSSNAVEAEEAIAEKSPEQWFNEQFDNLLPKIQERWPDLAKQTLEATKGYKPKVNCPQSWRYPHLLGLERGIVVL